MTDNETQTPPARPLVLMILDGWGQREDAPDNAISQAATPCWDQIRQLGSNTTIETSGEFVGLPAGQMGNSEVGHMNIGAGRVVFQDFTRISNAVEDGSFASNPTLIKAIEASRSHGSTLHIMGLLSPGGVHSHEDHFLAMVRMAVDLGAPEVRVHAFLAVPGLRSKKCRAVWMNLTTPPLPAFVDVILQWIAINAGIGSGKPGIPW